MVTLVALLVNCESETICSVKCQSEIPCLSIRCVGNFIAGKLLGRKKALKTAVCFHFVTFYIWLTLETNLVFFFPELLALSASSAVQKPAVSAWCINSKDSGIGAYLANLLMHKAKIE